MSDLIPPPAAEYKGSEKREQDEAVRKTLVKAVVTLRQTRATIDLRCEHARLGARADATYLGRLYRELTLEQKLPEDLVRAVIVRQGRSIIGAQLGPMVSTELEEDPGYEASDGPVGNEHG